MHAGVSGFLSMTRIRRQLAMYLAWGIGLALLSPVRVVASPAATLDLTFPTMPHWRAGPMPWPAVARPFSDPGFILSAGLMSGLRPAYKTVPGSDPAWASLHNEQEAYPNGDAISDLGISPFVVEDGALLLTALPMQKSAAATLPADMPRKLISGAFNTYPFSQTYGYFEITAKVPAGRGLWPAFWLLPVDQSWPPEIDIAEILGHSMHDAYSSIHTSDKSWVTSQHDSYNGNTTTEKATSDADLSNGFHRYAVDWTFGTITFLLDGKPVGSRPTPADMHKPFYLIVNLAVGDTGSWPGPPTAQTRFPASLAIRSIKIWASDGNARN